MIGEERLRQVRHRDDGGEGFSHAHDDTLLPGALSAAADCYIYLTHTLDAPDEIQGLYWPFHPGWFKPSLDRAATSSKPALCTWRRRSGMTVNTNRILGTAADTPLPNSPGQSTS